MSCKKREFFTALFLDQEKMRPWILRSAFPLAVLTTLIFVYIPFHRLGEGAGKAALYAYITLTTVSMKEMFRELKDNRMILIVFLIYLLGFARGMGLIVCVQANGALIGKINLLGMQNIVMFAYMGAAGVSALISAVPMFFYKIDFKLKEQMRRYNAEKETD